MKTTTCPTCGVHIDEHEATTCLDWWLASLYGETIEYPSARDIGNVAGYVMNGEEVCYFDGASMYKWVPSEDIAAAWPVFAALAERYGCKVSVFMYPRERADAKYWATVSRGNLQYDTPELILGASAPTAPLAICRAAIKAMEEK